MQWTESQRKAIEAKDRTLLVSAGAGSGKTTVLTRRLTERILAGDSVDDFLIVTFTKAAASDLKEKLYNSLNDALAVNPLDRHLLNQLFLLPGARISTIHSFCFDIIKRNFAQLGLSPNVRIADETEVNIIATDCIDELLNELYESGDEDVNLLSANFGSDKSDESLIEQLLSLYSRLRAFYGYKEWFAEKSSQLIDEAEQIKNGFFGTRTGSIIKEKILILLSDAKESACSLAEYTSLCTQNATLVACSAALCEATESLERAAMLNYKTLKNAFDDFSMPRFSYKGLSESEHEQVDFFKDNIKKKINEIRTKYCNLSEEEIYIDYIESARIQSALLKVICLFDEAFSQEKKKKGVLDYSDLEQYLAMLLENEQSGKKQPSELCEKLRKSFKEIYIDEYQDVNPLQDRIFSLLSRPDNRFMVGDLKQSIYRFRNAYPDIFVSYKESFPDYGAKEDTGSGARLFLKENFRCSKSVVGFVNKVFEKVTGDNRFSNEYRGEELIYAKNTSAPAVPVVVGIATYPEKDKLQKNNAKLREAEYVALEIKRLAGRERKEDGSLIEYKDIALLFSAVRGRSRIFEKALRKHGIPCVTQQDESLFGEPEVMLAVSALKAIDNPTDDISLCAVLRSPLYNFSADELFKLRTSHFGLSLYDSIIAATSLTKNDFKRLKCKRFIIKSKSRQQAVSLIKKCLHFLNELDYYRIKAQGTPCYKFLWLFYMRSGLLSVAGSVGKGTNCRDNLMMLYQYARSYENSGFKGLAAFITYITEISERGGDLANAKTGSEEGNFVRLMSIHKSKGLEFPVCFVVDAAREFGKNRDGAILLSRGYGIACKIKNTEQLIIRDTYLRKLFSDIDNDSSTAEELRKLYVALTRARERLYVTFTAKEGNVEDKEAKSFAAWITKTVMGQKSYDDTFDVYLIPDEFSEENEMITNLQEVGTQPVQTQINSVFTESFDLKNNLSWVYPHREAASTPAKLSVSELSHYENGINAKINEKMILKKPGFVEAAEGYGARKGTANHVFMQFTDFDYVQKNGVKEEAARLLQINMITQEQYNLLSYDHLDAFFSSPLYRQMRQSSNLYREKRFSLAEKAELFGGAEGEKLLVQGVIDCFFENEDGSFTLVDYKTDFLSQKDGEKILIERHKDQIKYYSKAVEAMTGKKVTRAVLYSFSLDKSVEVDLLPDEVNV